MKKLSYILLSILFIPTIVNAKTITCTSTSNYVIGQNVYDGASIVCSEGTAEIFAVTEFKTGYVENGYLAVEGKSYFMDVVWTGTFNSETDEIIVDDDDQSEFAVGCENGCHLSTEMLGARANNNANGGTELAVGVTYHIGDNIKLSQDAWMLLDDDEDETEEIYRGSYALPNPTFSNLYKQWVFNSFLPYADEIADTSSLYIGAGTNATEDRVPIGIRCISGNGTSNNPFAFELVYEDNQPEEEREQKEYVLANGDATATFTFDDGHEFELNFFNIMNLTIDDIYELTGIEITEEEYNQILDFVKDNTKEYGTLLGFFAIEINDGNMGYTDQVKFKLKLTEEMKKYNTFKFIYLDDENNFQVGDIVDFQIEGDYITGTIPHLSAYALVGSYVEPVTNPQTSDNIYLYVLSLGLSIFGLIGTALFIKNKKFN